MNTKQPEEVLQAGQIVYIMYRNPHTQNVVNVQSAAVVYEPENPGELALFLHDTYYPITPELAVYTKLEEAEADYAYYFGNPNE